MAESPAEPTFLRIGPETPASPVVLSVPHAGRAYSPALLKASRLPLRTLETLEDRFVDRLVWRAQAAGAVALIACAPRAEIDLNRDEREIDPAMVVPPPPRMLIQSPRARGGLGLVPTRINGAGSVWRHRIPAAELARRIAEIHAPYHAALERALGAARDRYGIAILLDCHSMPPQQDGAGPAVILGQGLWTAGALLPPLAGFAGLDLAPLIVGQVCASIGATMWSINQMSLRQHLTPVRLLGRVTAARRFLLFSAAPVGAVLGGFLGGTIGLRATLALGAVGPLVALLLVIFSPVRKVRDLSQAADGSGTM